MVRNNIFLYSTNPLNAEISKEVRVLFYSMLPISERHCFLEGSQTSLVCVDDDEYEELVE